MNTARVTIEKQELLFGKNDYMDNSMLPTSSASVVEGSFYQVKPMTIREMVTRKINKSLCCCLMVTILITFFSYYVSMIYEAKLNTLDNEIVRLNNENQDLQADLDRYKSFNNVDNKIGEYNLLQKADKVIEVTARNAQKTIATPTKTASNKFDWAIGY